MIILVFPLAHFSQELSRVVRFTQPRSKPLPLSRSQLADFGLSNHFQRGALLQTYCGSPLYAAPEIVKGLPYQGPEVATSC